VVEEVALCVLLPPLLLCTLFSTRTPPFSDSVRRRFVKERGSVLRDFGLSLLFVQFSSFALGLSCRCPTFKTQSRLVERSQAQLESARGCLHIRSYTHRLFLTFSLLSLVSSTS
jgi:hypothetical protein